MMSIGEVARRAGVRTSTLRYYERLGLLEAPGRENGRRRYGEKVLERLALLRFAQESGFTLREMKTLLISDKPYSKRLREAAQAKLGEIDVLIERAQAMKQLLRTALRCNCVDAGECGRRLLRRE
jgi:MerR family redox-sensitive transcriptional activator SoxR